MIFAKSMDLDLDGREETMELEDGGVAIIDHDVKFDPETWESVYPDDPRYDSLPHFNRDTLEFVYRNNESNNEN